MSIQDDFRLRLEQILGEPTAPFHETRVHARIREIARSSKRLRARADDFGNLLVAYGPGRPRLLFTGHTDHPALELDGENTATVRGGIRPSHLPGSHWRTFDAAVTAEVAGVIGKERPLRVRLRGAGKLRKGTPLILDVPAATLSRTKIRARAVDDLVAVAACLTAADRLEAVRWKGSVGFLFTRAEEVGFGGALAWARTTTYPRSTTIVNLEMSSALRHTPAGKGPILRVGDRMCTYSTDVTIALEQAAQGLEDFSYQRALMDGGACEATVFVRAGFNTGALCLPMKNAHNHLAKGGLGLEWVDARDAAGLVRWVVAFAQQNGRHVSETTLDKRLDALWKKHRTRLRRTRDG
jgi:endoglucanase